MNRANMVSDGWGRNPWWSWKPIDAKPRCASHRSVGENTAIATAAPIQGHGVRSSRRSSPSQTTRRTSAGARSAAEYFERSARPTASPAHAQRRPRARARSHTAPAYAASSGASGSASVPVTVRSGAVAARSAAYMGARGSSESSRAVRAAKSTARAPQRMKGSLMPSSPGNTADDRPMSQATIGG